MTPSPLVRTAVLVAAVACLGLAMCARSQPPPKTPANQAAAPPADAPPPEYFPATKAPGPLYR